MPSPLNGSTRPAASPTSSARARRDRGAGAADREPVTAQVLQVVDRDAVCGAQFGQMPAQSRPFARAIRRRRSCCGHLWEDPAVAAWDRRELEQGRRLVAPHRRIRRPPRRQVALQRDRDMTARGAPSAARVTPLAPSAPTRTSAAIGAVVGVHQHPVGGDVDVPHAHLVAELGPRGDGLLDQELIEPAPLGHEHQRRIGDDVAARAVVAHGDVDAVHDAFDDRIDARTAAGARRGW